MKKAVAGIVFLMSCLLATTPAFCEPNIVPNGGFENKKTDTLPTGWTTKAHRGTSAAFAFNTDEKHGGACSYMVTVSPPGGSLLLFPESAMTGITPGKKYQLSVWLKAKDMGYSPNFIAPAIRLNYKPSRLSPVPTIDLMLEMKGETGWKNLKLVTVAPADAQEITLDFLMTNGTVWIDDVEITEIN